MWQVFNSSMNYSLTIIWTGVWGIAVLDGKKMFLFKSLTFCTGLFFNIHPSSFNPSDPIAASTWWFLVQKMTPPNRGDTNQDRVAWLGLYFITAIWHPAPFVNDPCTHCTKGERRLYEKRMLQLESWERISLRPSAYLCWSGSVNYRSTANSARMATYFIFQKLLNCIEWETHLFL